MKKIKIFGLEFVLILALILTLLLFGCMNENDAKNSFVGTEIIKDNSNVNTDVSGNGSVGTGGTNQNSNTQSNTNSGQNTQTQNTNVGQTITEKPPIKSNSRLTTISLDKINLKEGDFANFPEIVPIQTKNLSKQSLMLYDGYEWYLKAGHMATYKFDPDGDYESPTQLVYSVVLRYETDYINDFIKYKNFNNITGKKIYNVSVGEYSIAYFEYPPNGAYKSIYTIEFVKYDIYVKVVVASKNWIVTSEDVEKYARAIEARIKK